MVRRTYKEPDFFSPPGYENVKFPSLPPVANIPIRKYEFNQTEYVSDEIVSLSADYIEDKCNIIVNVSAYSSFHARSKQFTYTYRKPGCDLPPPTPDSFSNLNLSGCSQWSCIVVWCFKWINELPTYDENGIYANERIYEPLEPNEYLEVFKKENPHIVRIAAEQGKELTVADIAQNGGSTGARVFIYGATVFPLVPNWDIWINGYTAYPAYCLRACSVLVEGGITDVNRFDSELKSFLDYKNSLFKIVAINYPKQAVNCDIGFTSYSSSPPPPPKKPEKNMCCPNVQQNDALLRLILKRIGTPQAVTIFDEDMDRAGDQKATKTPQTLFEGSKLNVERTEITNRLIGIENYPIKAPRTIIEDYKTIFPQDIVSLFEFAYENPEIELKSLTEFLNWQVEQESATMGQWYQIIQYETKDKNGQPKTERVELVNVAETLKEIIILLGGVNRNLTFLDDLLIRNINETIGAKTNAIRAMHIIEDIQDYLDYPTNEKSVSFPVSISLPDKNLSLKQNEDLSRFLKMSIANITYSDWTGKQSLHDILLDLLQASATIRGAASESGEELAHYFQFEDGGDIDV